MIVIRSSHERFPDETIEKMLRREQFWNEIVRCRNLSSLAFEVEKVQADHVVGVFFHLKLL